jgi:prepilin-type processing-associated H-X9-DG protein
VKRGKIIQGNIRDMQKNFKYIGNVKENFAQRMANMAFADGNRVGISLAKMEREE